MDGVCAAVEPRSKSGRGGLTLGVGQGLYVRVNIGNTSGGERRYLVCEVLGIRDKATEYQVAARAHAHIHGAEKARSRAANEQRTGELAVWGKGW